MARLRVPRNVQATLLVLLVQIGLLTGAGLLDATKLSGVGFTTNTWSGTQTFINNTVTVTTAASGLTNVDGSFMSPMNAEPALAQLRKW